MAAPKKRDQYAVALEALLSQFKVFGESLEGTRTDLASFKVEVRTGFERIDQRFDRVDQRFAQVDQRFAQVDQRFAQVDKRFAQIDQRFDQVDQRFDQVDQRLAHLEVRADGSDGDLRFLRAAVTEHSRELRELRAGQARIEAALDKKVDRDEVQAMIAQGLAGR